MPFIAIVLNIEADDGDRLSDALLEAGAVSVDCEYAAAQTPGAATAYDRPGELAAWPRLRLTALCQMRQDPERLLEDACTAAGVAAPAHQLHTVADENWVRKSQEQFAPIRLSGRLWIVPSWHVPPAPDAINIELDPGLAFGSGSHPTTRLCLAWLERRIAGGETVLDYGCGSGILTIAAMKLGAGRAVGVDIDPESVATARANAERNRITAQFLDTRAPLTLTADLVIANILANPLKVLAPLLASHCARGARLALSGILAQQTQEVEACYGPWFVFEPAAEMEGWVCLSGRRK